jgi:hypothetical protein
MTSEQARKNVVLKADVIVGKAGTAIGFHVEAINRDPKNSLAIVADGRAPIVTVLLEDEEGNDVTLSLPPAASRGGDRHEDQLVETILPLTGHAWFVAMPKEINQGKVGRTKIPKGRYKATMVVSSYRMPQDKGKDAAPATQAIASTPVAVNVDPEALDGEDLVDVYVENPETGQAASSEYFEGATAEAFHTGSCRATLKSVCIKANDGSVIGFHVEVINRESDKSLVVVVRDDVTRMCMIRLVDDRGREVTVFPKTLVFDKSANPKTFTHGTIRPQTSHSWFVPMPANIADIGGKPVPIVKGLYVASIMFSTSFYLQSAGTTTQPKEPVYCNVARKGPGVKIDVNPEAMKSANLIESYLDGSLPASSAPAVGK